MEDLKEVIVEYGMEYRLRGDGCYYPVIGLEQETDFSVGKYGIIYGKYIMEHHRNQYLELVMNGTWNQRLCEADEECHGVVELAVRRIMKKEGVTEELKAENPIEWVRRVNGIKSRVEEILFSNILK